jgi:hypothetical protein
MADNLREKLPTKESIIAAEDKVILSSESSNTTVDEFGRITFNEDNFPTIFLNNTTAQVASLSSYIETTTVDKLTSFETPEILALQYKHSSNAEGDVIGIAGHASTDINFEEHVNTIDPIDLTGGLQISKNAATKTLRDRKLASSDILLSPGVYRVECTGTFTLVGIAGGLDENGNIFGNGYKSYVVLELHKETQPGEILLYSTPAVEYSSEKNINDTTSSVTCYMYGYVSICNPSILKLKAKTAGEYAIGTVDPDSAGDFPDTFINPVQIVFEKVCDDPFCMEVSSSENDVFPGFIPFETTTLPPVITTPPPLTTTTTTTTTTISPPAGGVLSAAPPPASGGGGGAGDLIENFDIISCEGVGFCTISPYIRQLPKWGYLKADGSYQETTEDQAGWSWFSLLKKDPGSAVDEDYNSRVRFEGGQSRHNGGIMGSKPDPKDAIIFKTFVAREIYSFSSSESKDRGECDYCRGGVSGAVKSPKPTPATPLPPTPNKWKHSREEWCHLVLSSTTANALNQCPPGTEWTGEWTSTGPSSRLMGPGDSLYQDRDGDENTSDLRFPGDKANPKFWDRICKTPEPTEETGEDLDPGEDKCAVTLAWPCFVHDFGTTAITEDNMKSGKYEGKEITRTVDGKSVNPDRVGIELEEIFGDSTKILGRSTDAEERVQFLDYINKSSFFSDEIKDTFANLDKMKENYVDYVIPTIVFAGIPEAAARAQAESQFDALPEDQKLLWRTADGDAGDGSEEPAIIFEDKILPLLQRIQKNPPTTYNAVYSNQDILDLFSSPLKIIKNGTTDDTVVSQNNDIIKYTEIFAESLDNNTKTSDPTPSSKFYELAKFIAYTKYYETIINVRPAGGGYSGIEQWQNARNSIPSNIFSNKWWESKVLDNIAEDLNSNIFQDLIAGEGKEPEEFNTGNCCMTKIAMIAEAYWWNIDQFQLSNDEEYEFVPWWFKFKRSQVGDDDKPKKKTHKYEQGDEQSGINKYSWIKQPIDLLGLMDHPHPYADTAEATITQTGKFVLGCQD